MVNNQKTFSKKAALGFAFEALKNHFGILSLITILMFGFCFWKLLIIIVFTPTIAPTIKDLAVIIPIILFLPNLCLVALKICDHKKLDFKDVLPKLSIIGKTLTIVLWEIFVYLAFIFIIIIFVLALRFTGNFSINKIFSIPYFVLFFLSITLTYLYLKIKLSILATLDKSFEPLQAIKYVKQITQNNTTNSLLLVLTIYTIAFLILLSIILGIICKCISIPSRQILLVAYHGLYFFAFIISTLADAYIYRQLEPAKEV